MRGSSSPYKDNEKSYLCSWNEKVDDPRFTASGGLPVGIGPGEPALSPALQAGLGYTFGRCCFLASVEYDRFGFQGIETNVASEHNTLRTKVRTQGVFNDLTVQGKVQVRF